MRVWTPATAGAETFPVLSFGVVRFNVPVSLPCGAMQPEGPQGLVGK